MAQQELITDTIHLDSHEVINDAPTALQQLARTYQRVAIPNSGPLHRDMPLSSFAEYYGLDFGKLIDANMLSWAGNEHVKAYFDNLAVALTPWLSIVRKTMKSGASVDDTGMLLGQFFTAVFGGYASPCRCWRRHSTTG